MPRVNSSTFSDKEVTGQQKRWAEEYIHDFNATAAAIRAGYSPKGAKISGHENMRRVHVVQYVILLMAERTKRTQTSADRVVFELKRLALSNILNICSWDEDGNVTVKASDKISQGVAASISEIHATRTTNEVGEVTHQLKIKLYPKLEPLKLLGQHVGIFIERHEHVMKGVILHEHRKALERSLRDLPPEELMRIREDLNKLLPEEVRPAHVQPEQLTRSS